MADVCELVVGELAANAVNASHSPEGGLACLDGRVPVIRVRLLSDGLRVAVECWDEAPGVPEMRQAGLTAELGRGLALVDALAGGRWGWQPREGHRGKCVWACIAPDEPVFPLMT